METLIYDNPNLRSPAFHYLRDKMDGMFLDIISKVKTEHTKFRMWIKTYGFSIEVMKFIKNLTENSFIQVSGNYMSPIINEMYSTKNIEFPNIIENEVAALTEEVNDILERSSDLYLKPGSHRERLPSPSASLDSRLPSIISSKIVSDVAPLQHLFESKISKFKLLFRASENAFSIK